MNAPIKSALLREIEHEVEVTLQVAVLIAADYRGFEIRQKLGITNTEYDMCVERLRRVTSP